MLAPSIAAADDVESFELLGGSGGQTVLEPVDSSSSDRSEMRREGDSRWLVAAGLETSKRAVAADDDDEEVEVGGESLAAVSELLCSKLAVT